MNSDNNNFTIEPTVKTYVKEDRLKDLEKVFNLKDQTRKNIHYFDKILNSKDTAALSVKVNHSEFQLYKVDSLFLAEREEWLGDHMENKLAVYNLNGKKLTESTFNSFLLDGDASLKEVLTELKKVELENQIDYSLQRKKINNGQWTYISVLPYAFNMSGGVLKPLSGKANFIVGCHTYIGFSMLLSIITSFIYEFLRSGNRREDNFPVA